MLVKMYVLLHLLLSKLHPVSRLVVILPIHTTDVNNSIWLLPTPISCGSQRTRDESRLGGPLGEASLAAPLRDRDTLFQRPSRIPGMYGSSYLTINDGLIKP
jgi:hypothetical protein